MGLVDIERRTAILDYLTEHKKATVAELAEYFPISPTTIRRDLTKLEKDNQLVKTYGGAMLPPSTKTELSYNERLDQSMPEKKRIAAFAAKMIHPGDSIFLDSGTTTLQIAEAIENMENITVVTNGLSIAQRLRQSPGIQLYILGGLYRPQSQDMVGPALMSNLHDFAVDIAFLSVDGFHTTQGLSAADHSTAEVVRGAIEISKRSVIVADSSKGGKRSFARICFFDKIDVLITDKKADPTMINELRRLRVKIEVV